MSITKNRRNLLSPQAWLVALLMALLTTPSLSIHADDQFIDLDGTKVRVRIEGPETAAPVILLHGFTASLESWDGWAAALRDQYRIIRYDLMGHGLTGPDTLKRYAPMERVQVLADVMDALNIERAHIGGNSLGGLVAWRFAAENPERVQSLVLISPGAYSINSVTDTPVEAPGPMQMFLKHAPVTGVEFMLKNLFGDPARLTPARVASYLEMMNPARNGDAFIEHIAEFTLPDPSTDLARITAPTLIIWGSDDRGIPVEQGQWMAKAIKDARLEILEGKGHMAHEEAPETTAAIVIGFLKN